MLVDGWDTSMHWAWSGDSRHMAVAHSDQNHNMDIWLGPVDGSSPLVNVTKHPGTDSAPSFSLDNKILAFVSGRNGGQGDVYAVYLDKSLESYTPQELKEYYEQAAKAAGKLKPLKPESAEDESEESSNEQDTEEGGGADDGSAESATFDLADAYLRLRRLTRSDSSESRARILPGGNKVLFTRGSAVYTVGWDGGDEKKIADSLTPQHLSLTGKQVIGLRSGKPVVASTSGGKETEVAFPGSIRVDRGEVNRQRFDECARIITAVFYDGDFKGIDWPGATRKYAQLAARTRTNSEFDDVANRYLGLLDASHMGIRSPRAGAGNRQSNGRLGATYQRVERGYEVVAIEPESPAAEGPMRLKIGDVITAVDFQPLADEDTLPARLAGRVGLETAVTVLRQPSQEDDGEDAEPLELNLLITPISYGEYRNLRYVNWRNNRLARVEAMSDGKLGYIHIRGMNEVSLADFERDLYAACEGKQGMIIDVRDNGGGWTTDRLLGSIMTRRHAYTVPRDADPTAVQSYPHSRLFIPRYTLPMNALCNQNSFSNAEIFSHAFRTLERGTLVGVPTAGGVISTSGARLLDGTTIRTPFRGWYLPDGTDMENHGAQPHLYVPQTPEAETADEDRQLEAAVKDLLERL